MLTFTFGNAPYTPSLTFIFRDAGVYCHASIVLDDAIGSAVCEFDSNVSRFMLSSLLSRNQDADSLTLDLNGLSQLPVFTRLKACENQQNAQQIIVAIAANTQQMTISQIAVNAIEQDAQSLSHTITSKINLTEFLQSTIATASQDTQRIYNDWLAVQDVLEFIIQRGCIINSDTLAQLVNALFVNTPYSIQLKKRGCDSKQAAIKPPFGKSQRIDRPRPPPEPPPQHNGTLTIPTKEAYSMQHSITVVTLPDNQPIALSKLSLSYDVDSYAWTFSGVLADKSQLALVTMTNDEPVQLSITINTYNWIVLIEKIPETRSFGKTDITLQGRSLSALLGAPYQRLTSYTAGSDMTVQQIADALLPFGWTIDWQCATPWLVPANAFSYTQQTVIQALATIAQSIGAVLVPSRNSQVLTMQPRYPVLPWNYNGAGIDADLVIPDSAIESIGQESRTQSPINAVYVHGEQGGVLAWCRLTGTAGDVLAPTESNPLITDVTGARALGERILAGKATQPVTTSFTTFLGGDFVLASIGWLVQVNNERAIINGVSISVELGKVRQTITLGESTTNAYSKLLNLLPAQPLLVGNVIAAYDDKAVLALLDGGVITARGTGTVGQNYYVRNGLIESEAPNLMSSEIVI